VIEEANSADVVGSAVDGYTGIKLCRTLMPDIVLLDLGITRPSGMDTFRKMRSVAPDAKIIVYATSIEDADLFTLLEEGVQGFVPKQAKAMDFVNAVQNSTLGYVCIPNDYINDIMSIRKNAAKTGNIYGLSPREMGVFEACTSGMGTKEVAERLGISVRTVETHRNSIYRKTSCHSVADLIALEERQRLATSSDQ